MSAHRSFGPVVTLGVALVLAGALKLHYHRAGFEELRWILAPTARTVEWLSGDVFEVEPHRGYLSRARHFEIVPACAGVNFMIVAFLSVVLGLAPSVRSGMGGAALLLASTLAAWLVTIAANATRITIAMWMHDAQLTLGPLDADRLHRLEGVTVFFVFLCALYLVAKRLGGVGHAPAR